jgi:hypothetical protein
VSVFALILTSSCCRPEAQRGHTDEFQQEAADSMSVELVCAALRIESDRRGSRVPLVVQRVLSDGGNSIHAGDELLLIVAKPGPVLEVGKGLLSAQSFRIVYHDRFSRVYSGRYSSWLVREGGLPPIEFVAKVDGVKTDFIRFSPMRADTLSLTVTRVLAWGRQAVHLGQQVQLIVPEVIHVFGETRQSIIGREYKFVYRDPFDVSYSGSVSVVPWERSDAGARHRPDR